MCRNLLQQQAVLPSWASPNQTANTAKRVKKLRWRNRDSEMASPESWLKSNRETMKNHSEKVFTAPPFPPSSSSHLSSPSLPPPPPVSSVRKAASRAPSSATNSSTDSEVTAPPPPPAGGVGGEFSEEGG